MSLEQNDPRDYPRRMPRWLPIQIWSDVACPWCYLGKRRLDAAIAQFPHRDSVRIVWKAFELDRQAPEVYPPEPSYAQRLANKYRLALPRAQQMLDEMRARGTGESVTFDFSKLCGVNTFAAHQVSSYAAAVDDGRKQHDLAERLFRAYFTEGRVLSNHETLVELARDVGLDEAAVRAALDTQSYAMAARQEEQAAAEMGVNGVPFFVIGRYVVEGAQPAHVLLEVLLRAWNETEDTLSISDGEACTVDGCP